MHQNNKFQFNISDDPKIKKKRFIIPTYREHRDVETVYFRLHQRMMGERDVRTYVNGYS